MNPNEISILIIEPDTDPRIAVIPNTLEAKQKVVDGRIECFPVGIEGAIGVCNEDGLDCLEPNRFNLPTRSLIYGTFFIAGETVTDDGLTFCSLTPEQLEVARDLFTHALTFSDCF